jgi:hypothetical protein
MSESPIQNLDRIDLLGRRKDGGVDLVIVVSGPLENTADHRERVETKVRAYVRELSSPGFSAEFPDGEGRRKILLVTEHAVDQAVLALIDSLRRCAADAGSDLEIVAPAYFSKP